jgi:hypothetical protein
MNSMKAPPPHVAASVGPGCDIGQSHVNAI